MSIAVVIASCLSEIAYFIIGLQLYYYVIIWLASFGAVFGASYRRLRKAIPAILNRMKTSTRWPTATQRYSMGFVGQDLLLPISSFPSLYQYLILAGIGLGNLSTYLMIKKYSNTDNPEQLIVALVSLAAVPAAVMIDSMIFATRQDIAVMLSRIFIGIAYAAGGAFALLSKAGPIDLSPR